MGYVASVSAPSTCGPSGGALFNTVMKEVFGEAETVTLLRNYSLFLITPKYRFNKLCLYSITEVVVFIDDLPN
jgi:hypothetical protein